MASRRSIGKALQSSADMVQTYLGHLLQLERQKQSAAASAEAAKHSQDAQFDLSMIPRIASGEFNPATLAPTEATRMGGKVNLQTLYPSDVKRSGKVIGDTIGKANDLSSLPTDPELKAMLQAVGIDTSDPPGTLRPGESGPNPPLPPAVQMAMDARQAAEQKLYANQPTTSRTYIPDNDPYGREFQEFVPNSDLAARGGTPTEKTPQQAASYAVAQGEGTLPFDVKKAGSVAQATSAGQNREDWLNPAVFDKRLQLAREQALGSALASGNVAQAQKYADQFQRLQKITPQMDRIFELSSKVNVYAADNYTDRIGSMVGAALQTNPDAAEQQRLVKNVSRMLANDPNWGGNVGAQSEADAMAMEGRFPRVGDSDEVARRMISALKDQLTVATTRGIPLLQVPVSDDLRSLVERPLGVAGGGGQPTTPAPVRIDPNTFLPIPGGR